MGLALRCVDSVSGGGGRFIADTVQPWLAVPALAAWRGRWVCLRYRTGLFDECVRPLIRFDGSVLQPQPMNGAIAGVAEWIGRIPGDATGVSISPVRRRGAFSFEIESVRPVSRLALVLRGLRRRPKLTLMALGARLIGARSEAHHCLKFAALGTAMTDYGAWLTARQRDIDLEGFDAPRADWSQTPALRILVSPNGDDGALARTRAAITEQSYPYCSVHAMEGRTDLRLCDFAPTDIVASVTAGDILLPHAAGGVIEAFAAAPALAACYGDEDTLDGSQAPRFKPDWSPVFQAGGAYCGAGAFVRAGALKSLGCETADDVRTAETRLAQLPPGSVGHLRRLVWRRGPKAMPGPAAAPLPPVQDLPRAAIIVPTRDQPVLLRACLDGILRRTAYPSFELVILDNGTTDAAALALLAEAERDARVRVLRAPGPFNYAALCNRGSAASDAPLLVFLNNDVVITDSDWLGQLARWAMQPQIGAVGPKLLYPDGRVQHGGDVIGMGETAQHAYRLENDDEGYLGQLAHTREVGAVTGAVQAVAREKFEAVGGFDEKAFAVLLNDTDLCLKLASRGWYCLYVPGPALIHAESASRGFSMRPFTLYGGERRHFVERWLEAIRDDPYFHPALSLYCYRPSLA